MRIADLLRTSAVAGGAVAGGVVGAAMWVVASLTAHLELGWVAWAVGVLAGLGARAVARAVVARRSGAAAASPTTGLIAAGVAVVSIFAARALVVHVTVDRELVGFRGVAVSDELATSYLADEVVAAWEAAGRELAWPVDSPFDVPQVAADYPADVWAEAAERFAAMDAGEREAYRQALFEEREREHAAFAAEWRRAGLRAGFEAVNLVFLVLAVATAYRIARGPARAAEG